ncbi:MAG: hypothetical protein HYZ75_14420 [Elusimicrobia bacterium]|nr:hypothetical protein [Elusimicrobiota bacterium]
MLSGAARAEAPVLGPLGRLPFPAGEGRSQAGLARLGWFQHGTQGGPAARPDGSGKALALYQLSLVDAYRSKNLALMGDAFCLSDRRSGPAVSPTQVSWLAGGALEEKSWRLEAAREDHRPLDRDGLRFQAWRAGLRSYWGEQPGGTRDSNLPAGIGLFKPKSKIGLSGDWGVDWYFFNKTLPAKSDLTGIQHLRYSLRGTLGDPKGPWRLVGSAELPTSGRNWSAAELNASVGAALRWKEGEVLITRQIRDSLDGPGYHAWWQFGASWSFAAPEGAL